MKPGSRSAALHNKVDVTRQEEIDAARALTRGDGEAFQLFFTHFRQKVFRHMWLMCGVREDAEEVAQETLLKVFTRWRQLVQCFTQSDP